MQYRCKNCNKLLAKGEGQLEIKCPRCKTVNRFGSLTTQNAAEHPNPIPSTASAFYSIYKESK